MIGLDIPSIYGLFCARAMHGTNGTRLPLSRAVSDLSTRQIRLHPISAGLSGLCKEIAVSFVIDLHASALTTLSDTFHFLGVGGRHLFSSQGSCAATSKINGSILGTTSKVPNFG